VHKLCIDRLYFFFYYVSVFCLNTETYEYLLFGSRFAKICTNFLRELFLLFEGFGNRVLRKIFECKIDETSAGRMILQSKKLHKFCKSTNIVRIIK